MVRKPDYYKTPLRSRAAIISFLQNHRDYRNWPLAWNVKAYDTDLSFDHLLEVFKASGYFMEAMNSTAFLSRCRELHAEHEAELWNWGQEAAWREVTDTDSYNHLWDGTPLSVKYTSEGRSCGYIVLTEFEGCGLRNETDFSEWNFEDLRKLYSLVVMLDHDWTNDTAARAIEEGAAWDLFVNIAGEPVEIMIGVEIF